MDPQERLYEAMAIHFAVTTAEIRCLAKNGDSYQPWVDLKAEFFRVQKCWTGNTLPSGVLPDQEFQKRWLARIDRTNLWLRFFAWIRTILVIMFFLALGIAWYWLSLHQ